MAATANLNRLLSRLDHALLSPTADPRLQHSQYERNRIGANIEHARAMLLTLDAEVDEPITKEWIRTGGFGQA